VRARRAGGCHRVEVRAVDQTRGDPITYARIEQETRLPPQEPTWLTWLPTIFMKADVQLGYDEAIQVPIVDSMSAVVGYDSTWYIQSLYWHRVYHNLAGAGLREPKCTFDNTARTIICEPSDWATLKPDGSGGYVETDPWATGYYTGEIWSGGGAKRTGIQRMFVDPPRQPTP
jgi:hypothetical protein